LRDTTERPEGVKAGTLKLVGTQVEPVKKAMLELLENKDIYNKMANAKNPYGDGHASDRIINDIVYYFSDKSGPRPKDFE
jgi:UDP-N-acetylglucosamine 2-epimerase (non-hydrolysing)